MAKSTVSQTRLFKNIFLCKKCGARLRVDPKKIIEGKIHCRRCKNKTFRAIKHKK